MTRSDLIEHLTALAEDAEQSGERDIAMVLFAQVLAIGEKTDTELACFVALAYGKRPEVQRMSAA